MTSMDLAAALPALIALAGALLAGHGPVADPRRVVRLALGAQILATISAVTLAVFVFAGVPITGHWFEFDRLSAVIVLLTAGIAVTIHAFSERYMDGDVDIRRFFRNIGLLSSLILLMVSVDHIVLLALAWLGASWVLAGLVRYRHSWPAARAASRRTLGRLAIGDVAFVAGAILAVILYGTADVHEIAAAAAATAGEAGTQVLAVLLIVAALAKSAQLPLHGWLPDTMTAPTPVSALMHGGFVNAAGYMLARFSEMFIAQPGLLFVVFAIGAVTALFGAVVMLVQTDIKRALGYSTIGQMGFMVMQCGLGAFAAAVYHMVVHGLFKATLFLGAGSTVGNARALKNAPAARIGRRRAGIALAAALPVGALLVAAGVAVLTAAGAGPTALLLSTFALMALFQAVVLWARHPEALVSSLLAALVAGAVGFALYIGGLAAFTLLLAPELAVASFAPTLWHWLVPALFGLALALSLVPWGRSGGALQGLRDRLYVRLLFVGIRPLERDGVYTHRDVTA